MKVLCMSDSPNISTGMGRVHREIALGLHKRGYQVESLGWFSSSSIENKMPFKIYPTRNQYYGADVFDDVIIQSRPDCVLTIGDAWMISYIANRQRCKARAMFQWIGYLPLDGAALGNKLPPTWVQTFKDMDVKVAYTEYGKRIILNTMPELKDEIKIIPHGVDIETYKPLPEGEVRNLRRSVRLDMVKTNGEVKKKVCFLIVARNQFRKNIPEILKVWKKFKANGRHERAVLWLHMNFQDSMGWNLDEILDIVGVRDSVMFFDQIAHGATNIKLMPEGDLNKLYNACDIFMLISGEGFGLPIAEAMACGKPVIVLDHSACSELAQGRGEVVKVAHYVTGKYSTERPYPDEIDLLRAMDNLYRDEAHRSDSGASALKFIREGAGQYHGKALTWDSACDQWDEVFKEVEHPLASPIKLREIA